MFSVLFFPLYQQAKMSVTLHTTKGDIKIQLECDKVKRSTANFLALCASNKYDKTIFHRVIRNFIIQTGSSDSIGKRSTCAFPGMKRLPDETHSSLTFRQGEGIVAFANSGKLSNKGVGSQFFITVSPDHLDHLDGSCTIIGKVISGMDAVKAISEVEVNDDYRPEHDICLDKVNIHANPFASGHIQFQIPCPLT